MMVDQSQVARTCIPVDVVLSFSGVTFTFVFCFVFVFVLLLNPRPFAQSFFDIYTPRQPHAAS